MNILFILPGYPSIDDGKYLFLGSFIDSIANLNINATIITPVSVTRSFFSNRSRKFIKSLRKSVKLNENVTLKIPRYLSFSNLVFFGFNISTLSKNISIFFSVRNEKFDLVYSHFWTQLLAGYMLSKSSKLLISSGESRISIQGELPKWLLNLCQNRISGVIGLSSINLKESTKLIKKSEISKIVIPNAANTELFKPLSLNRNSFGVPMDSFIVGFIGSDEPRKGLKLLIEAISKVREFLPVQLLVIGKIDNSSLRQSFIIETGILEHKFVPIYLNLCDIFCHVSSAEGSSNAIIEALACGLPVIASNRRFNDDILDSNNSIRIDENKANEIEAALVKLITDHKLRSYLRKNALEYSAVNNLKNRINRILEFINEIISDVSCS